MSEDFDLVDFDPSNADHADWVHGSFRATLKDMFPWGMCAAMKLADSLRLEIDQPGTVTKVITTKRDPDGLIGWVCTRPYQNVVVFCYVKFACRRYGVASSAILETGVDLTKRTGVVYWTRACERILIEHSGYDLYFKVTE